MNWQCVVTRRDGIVDGAAEPAALSDDVDERDRRRWGADALVHQALQLDRQRARRRQPATRRGPLRDEGAIDVDRPSRHRVAISRLATPSSPVTAGGLLAADGIDECDQFGAQRLVMADRDMPHRIGAIRLKAEAFGDLTGEQIAHHVLAARRDGDVARLEWREPVGVDVGQHAGGGAELQQRDVLALGDRAGKLRLHFDDVGIGEPADQIDVVDGEIDHHADIRHARRKRTDARDRDRKNVLAADRFLDRGHGGIEALDVADHRG